MSLYLRALYVSIIWDQWQFSKMFCVSKEPFLHIKLVTYRFILMLLVNTKQNPGFMLCGTDKFGFVVTCTHNDAMIKLLSTLCVPGCYVSGVRT